MATKYGYMIYTFRVHRRGKDPEKLGVFDGTQDALPFLYGALNGLKQRRYSDKSNRHIRTSWLDGVGRTVRFKLDVGQSGQSSDFYLPDNDEYPVFERTESHIEANKRRGLIVAPSQATTGLLITEVHGRSGIRSLLGPLLSKSFSTATSYILDIASVVDETALEKFVAEAHANQITLRKSGLPDDIADAVEVDRDDAHYGELELRIKPGRIKQFQRALISRLRGDDNARNRLLTLHEFEFDELSVGMTVGDRQTTLTVTADRVPTFVYELRSAQVPTDEEFFHETLKATSEVGPAVGAIVTPGWDSGSWSKSALDFMLELPVEDPEHVSTR